MSPDAVPPLVSVIIATYNWSSVLKYAIQSVLWQTFQDFEVLVIGDACTDDSDKVVAAFHDVRLRWHNLPENSGSQSIPNNAGLEMAQGKYIAYLGHDDLWYPTHLELLVKHIQETESDVVYSLCCCIGPPANPIRFIRGISESGQYEHGLVIPPSSVMHRRDMIRDTGNWRDYRTIQFPPDVELWARAHSFGQRFVAVSELTVIKFPSAMRPNSYRERASGEQAEVARRIQAEPDFLYRELVETVIAYATGRTYLPHKLQIAPELLPGEIVEEYRKTRGLPPLMKEPRESLPRRVLKHLPGGVKGRLRRVLKTVVWWLRE